MIVVLRGIMGAGKSTLAAQLALSSPHTAIVSRDTIRERHFHRQGRLDDRDEDIVSELEMRECIEHLDRGCSVIIDATNLEPDHVQRWQTLAADRGIDCLVIDVYASLETCIANVAHRAEHGGHDVDEQVIRQVWRDYPPGTWMPPPDHVIGERPLPFHSPRTITDHKPHRPAATG
ncbi:ATP-binding protein [Nocardia abscessus]|uniref:AAA family ATPase n=1 Tax=Nocardia abscessus TaxID=120957 RepID=UPI001892E04C|nr:AAA family ATPase [Nocardia abscessus]MBF6341274.1 ATP-binding protein [Nocardia abscessus]